MDVLRHILFLINVKFTETFLRKLYMENPNNTNLLGLSAILQNPNKMYVIQEWYDFGVYDQKLFKEKFCTKSIERKSIDQLIDRQKEWSVNNNIHSTPSFMLNGHFLPKGFNFMDIINF